MIRAFESGDLDRLKEIQAANNLPPQCFPNLVIERDGEEIPNPLFVVKAVYEHEGKSAMMSFVKGTAELYLFLDHSIGTPEERWEWLKEFKEYVAHEAWLLGLEQISAWIPNDIEPAFAKRLEEMGFIKSPWSCYSLNLEK